MDPRAYFDLVRKARLSINVPERFESPSAAIQQAPADIVGAFLDAIPQLPADSVVATCSRDSLKEACRSDSVIVPPVR